jgi:hypothetical protein
LQNLYNLTNQIIKKELYQIWRRIVFNIAISNTNEDALEDELLLRHIKHSNLKHFYASFEVMKRIDEETFKKQVVFREYLFIENRQLT